MRSEKRNENISSFQTRSILQWTNWLASDSKSNKFKFMRMFIFENFESYDLFEDTADWTVFVPVNGIRKRISHWNTLGFINLRIIVNRKSEPYLRWTTTAMRPWYICHLSNVHYTAWWGASDGANVFQPGWYVRVHIRNVPKDIEGINFFSAHLTASVCVSPLTDISF